MKIKLLAVPLALGLVLLTFDPLQAQQPADYQATLEAQQNVIYLELLGNGILYTLNYERLVSQNLYLRLGGMYLGFSTDNGNTSTTKFRFFNLPIVLNKLIGKGNGKLELGAGLMYYSFMAQGSDDREIHYPGIKIGKKGVGITTTLGYRHQYKSNLIIRAGIQPRYLFGTNSGGFGLAPGISIGAAF